MTNERILKIRRVSDGLFSTGGYSPRFNNKGKQWKTKGAFHNHLNLIHGNIYDDCEVVAYELVEVAPVLGDGMLGDYCKARNLRKQQAKEAEKKQRNEEQLELKLEAARTLLKNHGEL